MPTVCRWSRRLSRTIFSASICLMLARPMVGVGEDAMKVADFEIGPDVMTMMNDFTVLRWFTLMAA